MAKKPRRLTIETPIAGFYSEQPYIGLIVYIRSTGQDRRNLLFTCRKQGIVSSRADESGKALPVHEKCTIEHDERWTVDGHTVDAYELYIPTSAFAMFGELPFVVHFHQIDSARIPHGMGRLAFAPVVKGKDEVKDVAERQDNRAIVTAYNDDGTLEKRTVLDNRGPRRKPTQRVKQIAKDLLDTRIGASAPVVSEWNGERKYIYPAAGEYLHRYPIVQRDQMFTDGGGI